MNFSEDQQAALEIMKNGDNVFLTGKAGTGKTAVLNAFLEWAQDEGKNIIACAPTGAAAQRIETITAYTVHRAFGLKKVSIVRPPAKAKKEIQAADIIVIDEISMCRIDLFEHVARAVQLADEVKRKNEERLARKQNRERQDVHTQLIVVGDFCQLEPVLTTADRKIFQGIYGHRLFAFESKLWAGMGFRNAILRTIHRVADDKAYAESLNSVRTGEDPFVVEWFDDNTAKNAFVSENSVILCGKNSTAQERNNERLAGLPGEEIFSPADIKGDADISSTNAEYALTFKEGARVMMLVNSPLGDYFNGSFGTITECLDEDTVKVKIEETGKVVLVKKHTWTVSEPVAKEKQVTVTEPDGQTVTKTVTEITEKETGSVTQFPFKLAWAITIHKSQGMTLKNGVNLYPEFFANGQMYVALSRVDRGSNLYINGILQFQDLRTSPRVRKFYRAIDKEWGQ